MMNTQIAAGSVALGSLFGLLLRGVSGFIEPQLIVAHDMHVDGDMVTIDRTIYAPAGIADWQVVVVPVDGEGPSCSTATGPKEGQGWNDYTPAPRSQKQWHIDEWVGDPGCWAHLDEDRYLMHVTWTPRDGRPSETISTEFTKETTNG